VPNGWRYLRWAGTAKPSRQKKDEAQKNACAKRGHTPRSGRPQRPVHYPGVFRDALFGVSRWGPVAHDQ